MCGGSNTVNEEDRDSVKTKWTIATFLLAFSQCVNRSQKWDFLYSTEYECESQELNEAMAAMTDDQVTTWFPSICADYLRRLLKEGEIKC